MFMLNLNEPPKINGAIEIKMETILSLKARKTLVV